MNEKPIVFFEHGFMLQYQERAALFGIKGHPRFGDTPEVYTSKVLSYQGSPMALHQVETLNTIYCRQEELNGVMEQFKQEVVEA